MNEMNKDDLKHRTRQLALRVIRVVESLPKGKTADVIVKQLLRSGTVGWALPTILFAIAERFWWAMPTLHGY